MRFFTVCVYIGTFTLHNEDKHPAEVVCRAGGKFENFAALTIIILFKGKCAIKILHISGNVLIEVWQTGWNEAALALAWIQKSPGPSVYKEAACPSGVGHIFWAHDRGGAEKLRCHRQGIAYAKSNLLVFAWTNLSRLLPQQMDGVHAATGCLTRAMRMTQKSTQAENDCQGYQTSSSTLIYRSSLIWCVAYQYFQPFRFKLAFSWLFKIDHDYIYIYKTSRKLASLAPCYTRISYLLSQLCTCIFSYKYYIFHHNSVLVHVAMYTA